VFCDGDFWHGRDWTVRREKLAAGANPAYWHAKIESNMTRDAEQTAALKALGWTVVRVWETEVRRDVADVATRVQRLLASQA
jgi:DNA mismatch endonuclease (patch repair protein)